MSDYSDQSGDDLGLKRQLAEWKRSLAVANQELEALSYAVSHDLRGPLRIMDGFSRILMEEYADALPEQATHYLNRICSGSDRMKTMIDGLLQLSRINKEQLRLEDVDLSTLAEECASRLRAKQVDRTVTWETAPNLSAKGDRALLTMALDHLLDNAWKFTALEPRAKIEFGLEDDSENPHFFIRDNGAGFNMKYANKLFTPFQSLHGGETFTAGIGIGLASVQRIIHRHDGEIWAGAQEGGGAIFYFTLVSRQGVK